MFWKLINVSVITYRSCDYVLFELWLIYNVYMQWPSFKAADILDDTMNYNVNKQNSYELPKNMTDANWTRTGRNCMQHGLVQNSSLCEHFT